MEKVVSIPNSFYKAVKGKYFLGQTDLLLLGGEKEAWGGLVNPNRSEVIMFVNVMTVSNFTDMPFTAQIWHNSSVPEGSQLSDLVAPANSALKRPIRNEVEIRFLSSEGRITMDGINVFDRVVPPYSTVVKEDDGRFIFGEEGTYSVLLTAPDTSLISARLAFGWWEEKIGVRD